MIEHGVQTCGFGFGFGQFPRSGVLDELVAKREGFPDLLQGEVDLLVLHVGGHSCREFGERISQLTIEVVVVIGVFH